MQDTEYGGQQDIVLYSSLVVAQAVVWAFLYHKEGCLRGPLIRFADRDVETIANIVANGQDAGGWSFWIIVALHHGLSGILALFGALFGNIWLFRLGLSFEIGEDFLHYFQMIQATLFPPGPEIFGELYTTCSIWIVLACHRAVGAVAGSYIFLYLPDWPDAQICIVTLLLSAVPPLLQFPFMPYENLKGDHVSCVWRIGALVTIVGTLFAIVCRVFVFPLVAWRLFIDMRKAGHSDTAANSLLASAGLFMIFAFVALYRSGKQVIAAVGQFFQVPKKAGVRAAWKHKVLAATEAQLPTLGAATSKATASTRKSM